MGVTNDAATYSSVYYLDIMICESNRWYLIWIEFYFVTAIVTVRCVDYYGRRTIGSHDKPSFLAPRVI